MVHWDGHGSPNMIVHKTDVPPQWPSQSIMKVEVNVKSVRFMPLQPLSTYTTRMSLCSHLKTFCKLLQAFEDLKDTAEECTLYNKVTELLDKIQVSQAHTKDMKEHICNNFQQDINGAITYLEHWVS